MEKQSCRKDEYGIKSIILSFGFVVIVLLIWGTQLFYEFKPDVINNPWFSLTLFFSILVPIVIIFFCIIRRKCIYGFNEKEGIDVKNAELHYNNGMNNIRSIIMVYVIAISLLWGFAISNPGAGVELKRIEYQLEYGIDFDSNESINGNITGIQLNETLNEIQKQNRNFSIDLKQQGMIVSIVTWYAILVYYVSLVEDFRDILNNGKKDDKKQALQKENANEILKLRYTKGKITKEEYEQMKKDIDS